MQCLIVLCLAAIFTVHVAESTPLSNVLTQLRSLQNEAISISDELRHTANQLVTGVNTRLNDAKVAQMGAVRTIVERAFKNISEASDYAHSQGLDPSTCYANSKKEFDRAQNDGYSMLNTCVDESIPLINTAISQLESTANTAQRVANEIGSKILSCSSPGIILQTACLIRILPQSWTSVATVRYGAEAAKNAATIAMHRAISQANTCFPQKLAPLHPRVQNLRLEGLECIKGLH